MTPSPSARSQGAALRQARHARVRGIRRRVVAGALALFIATWLLITITLASGNDPALAANAAKAAATSAAATGTQTTGTSTQSSGASAQTTSTSSQSSSTSAPSSGTSSLTSSQS
jgi:hypothetical protein